MKSIKKNYFCPKCMENFGNKKSHYERHINRKIPCTGFAPKAPDFAPVAPDFAPKAPDFAPIAPKNPNNAQCTTLDQNIKFCDEIMPSNAIKIDESSILVVETTNITETSETSDNTSDNTSEINKKIECIYCKAKFSRKYCLDRHLDKRCKKKREDIEMCKIPKNDENNKSNKNNKNNKNNENNEDEREDIKFVLAQLKQFKTELLKVKEENELLKAKINTNICTNTNTNTISNCNNTNTNTNTITNNIINFNNVDYSKIDTDYFIGPMLDNKLFGRGIVLKVIENVHANDKLPEYKNYVITDKNRGYAKMYDNGMWKSTDMNGIEIILCGVIEQMRTLIEEIEDGNLEPVKKALRKEIQDIKIDFVNRRVEINKKYLDKSDLDKI